MAVTLGSELVSQWQISSRHKDVSVCSSMHIGPEFTKLAGICKAQFTPTRIEDLIHNPEVLGSNPSPATIFQTTSNGRFWFKHALIP
jgi:hypothetical protein